MTRADRTGSSRRADARFALVVLAALASAALVVGLAGGLVGPASAGDTAGALSLSDDEFDVDRGETVRFDVAMVNDGERDDDGVYEISLRLDYPPEYLTVTEIEPAGWFHEAPAGLPGGESQEAVEVRDSVAYDDERGAARLVQSLAEPTTGVTGEATVATVTVRVEPDAEPGVVELGTRETSTELTSRTDYPQPLSTPSATFTISGGGSGDGEVVTPAYDEDAFSDRESDDASAEGSGSAEGNESDEESRAGNETTDGGETAADGGETATDGDGTAESDDEPGTGDEVPAPLGAVVLGIAAAGVYLSRR